MTDELTYYRERLSSLRTERETWIPEWRELSEHLMPRQSRFLVDDRNKGGRRNNKIINERGVLALRTLASGMMSGMTNPARPWIALRTPDPDLNEYQPVKLFLETTRNRMMEIFLRSNVYTTLPIVYRDLGGYGTSAYLALEDPQSLLRCFHFPMGSYHLATDHRGRMEACYREFSMTANQMVNNPHFKGNCSVAVKNLAGKGGSKDSWVQVVHAIEKNPDYSPAKAHFAAYKAFRSCYFEAGGDSNTKLYTGGFDRFPVLAPRWDVTGEDVYGSSPGMESLGSNKQLQLREKRKGQLIDKAVAPPMTAPASLKNQRHSILSGDITYLDQNLNGQKFEPAYLPQPAFYQWILEDIASLENRISRTFFEDLFLMLANDQRSNITAREIAERHEEKLLQLGPVLLRQNDEHYDPLIDITFDMMARAGILPAIPPELQNMDLGIEYISILSQAMKLVGVSALERGIAFAGNMIPVWPEVRHMINPYNTVTEYFGTVGVSPKVLNDKKVVDAAMQAEAQQKQAAQMAAMAQPMSQAAGAVKDLATAPAGGNNALTQMMAKMQGQPAPQGEVVGA